VFLEKAGLKLDRSVPELGCTLGESLLRVHPSYLEAVREIRKKAKIKGIAHITGGGIEGNLGRIIPEGCSMEIHYGSWRIPPVFDLVQRRGPVEPSEMRRVFNMGVGMALVVSGKDAGKLIGRSFGGWEVFEVGRVT
jgi:phosphoribosylformylglycinamidine cyclo-ligase